MASGTVAHKIECKPRTGDIMINENVDFKSMLLSDPVLKGLEQCGFERPSPIQLKAIPLGRCGLDLIVQAKSGTGKTCVFSVIALDSIVTNGSSLQVLILAPTREIAVQIWEVVTAIGVEIENFSCFPFIGGLPLEEDKKKIKKCHIAVGTPGRIKQLIDEGIMDTQSIRLFVLDEADKLMEEGFQEVINWIYSTMPDNKQILALSATYPESLAKHLMAYMRNPTFIRLNSDDPALLGIRQYCQKVSFHPLTQKAFDYKVKELVKILSTVSFNQCLVFSNFQTRAQSLSDILEAAGWPSTYISASQDQQHRLTAMARLKKYKCRVLISTDLTSRGIDAENVNLVINLDIPKDHETYLHRIGRAGRFGSYGAGISLASEGEEFDRLYSIQQKCKTTINTLPDPIPPDLAHSSGYVNINNLVTTEKMITSKADISDETPELKVHEKKSEKLENKKNSVLTQSDNAANVIEEGTSDTNGQSVTSKAINMSNGITEKKESFSDKDIVNDNFSSGGLASLDNSDIHDNDDENKNTKRKILKSSRNRTTGGKKKHVWNDCLSTQENSIQSESSQRDSGREAVIYTDVDIFGAGSGGSKKGKGKKGVVKPKPSSTQDKDDKSNCISDDFSTTEQFSPTAARTLMAYDDCDMFSSSSGKKKKDKNKKNRDKIDNSQSDNKENTGDINRKEQSKSSELDSSQSDTGKEVHQVDGSGDQTLLSSKPKQMWSQKYKDEKDPVEMTYDELLTSYVHFRKTQEKDSDHETEVVKVLNDDLEEEDKYDHMKLDENDINGDTIEVKKENTNEICEDIEIIKSKLRELLLMERYERLETTVVSQTSTTFIDMQDDYDRFKKLDESQQKIEINNTLKMNNKRNVVTDPEAIKQRKLNHEKLVKEVEKMMTFLDMKQKDVLSPMANKKESVVSNLSEVSTSTNISKLEPEFTVQEKDQISCNSEVLKPSKPLFMMGMKMSSLPAVVASGKTLTPLSNVTIPLHNDGNELLKSNTSNASIFINKSDSEMSIIPPIINDCTTEKEGAILVKCDIKTDQMQSAVVHEEGKPEDVVYSDALKKASSKNKGLRPPEDQSLGIEYIKMMTAPPSENIKGEEKEDGEISEEEELKMSDSLHENNKTASDSKSNNKDKEHEGESYYRGKGFGEWVPVEPEESKYEYGEELLDYAYYNDQGYDVAGCTQYDEANYYEQEEDYEDETVTWMGKKGKRYDEDGYGDEGHSNEHHYGSQSVEKQGKVKVVEESDQQSQEYWKKSKEEDYYGGAVHSDMYYGNDDNFNSKYCHSGDYGNRDHQNYEHYSTATGLSEEEYDENYDKGADEYYKKRNEFKHEQFSKPYYSSYSQPSEFDSDHNINNSLLDVSLQHMHAQQSMWASYMNHIYWLSLGQGKTPSLGFQHWDQMYAWHKQWAQYYKDMSYKIKEKEMINEQYRSRRSYTHKMTYGRDQ